MQFLCFSSSSWVCASKSESSCSVFLIWMEGKEKIKMTLRSAENSSELADFRCSAALNITAKCMGTWIENADLHTWKVGANRAHQVVCIYLFLAGSFGFLRSLHPCKHTEQFRYSLTQQWKFRLFTVIFLAFQIHKTPHKLPRKGVVRVITKTKDLQNICKKANSHLE